MFTHITKDRNSEVCNRTQIRRTPCRKRTGNAVRRPEKFGDLITADHKVLNEGCESWNNHRYSFVVQYLAIQWIQSYPCKRDPPRKKTLFPLEKNPPVHDIRKKKTFCVQLVRPPVFHQGGLVKVGACCRRHRFWRERVWVWVWVGSYPLLPLSKPQTSWRFGEEGEAGGERGRSVVTPHQTPNKFEG